MIQLDGSTELDAILDGVFKPARREERRQQQRHVRGFTKHHPLLTLNYPGASHDAAAETSAKTNLPGPGAPTKVATTEDLIRTGHADGRVINPPPPERPNPEEDPAADLYGLGYVPTSHRIWSDGK